MKVLVIHNYYQQRGGEDIVFESESELLESCGHEVHREIFHNDTISSDLPVTQKLDLAASTIWSRDAAQRIRKSIRRFRPDVAHFHNTFPLVSPSAYEVCAAERVPVVQTLHNYRLLCSKALFFRNNQVCQDCLGRRVTWPGILHACYRDSRTLSTLVTGMQATGWMRKTWTQLVSRYVALSEFGRSKFVEGGLPAERITVKPNFLAPDPGFRPGGGGYALFVGRLSAEKGISTLLEAWNNVPDSIPLRIIGTGPMRDQVRDAAASSSNVIWLGEQPLAAILDELSRADALVFPSMWFEGNPRVMIESLAVGTPVVASRLGTMAEMITDGQNGLLFEPGSAVDLRQQVCTLFDRHPTRFREGARRAFLDNHEAEANYKQLISIYDDVLGKPA